MRYVMPFLLFSLYLAAPVSALGPLDYTRSILERATAIVVSNHTHNQKLAELSALFRQFLDTDSMGREALGDHWATFTPDQRKEFLPLFHELMEQTYVAKLLLFENPKFVYISSAEVGDGAEVLTRIVTPNDEFEVTYRLKPYDDHWMTNRIIVEGVNLSSNLGSQLDDLLSKMSAPELIALMQRLYGTRIEKE